MRSYKNEIMLCVLIPVALFCLVLKGGWILSILIGIYLILKMRGYNKEYDTYVEKKTKTIESSRPTETETFGGFSSMEEYYSDLNRRSQELKSKLLNDSYM